MFLSFFLHVSHFFGYLNVQVPSIQTVCRDNEKVCIIIPITALNYSYIVDCDAEIIRVSQGGPGHVVQQVDFFGASTGLMVSDIVS